MTDSHRMTWKTQRVYAGETPNFIIIFANTVVGVVAFFVFSLEQAPMLLFENNEAYGLARMNKTHTAGLCW